MANNKHHEYKGKRYTTRQLAELSGRDLKSVWNSIKYHGGDVEAALKQTPKKRLTHIYKGKRYTTKQLADIAGTTRISMWYRIVEKGLTPEQAIAMGKSQSGPRPKRKSEELSTPTPWDPDLELKRRIEAWKAKGMTEEEIIIKTRIAA
ncbi:hypothetical protein [Methylophaga lonarensis]|uniref:hypothetical protein n=1 Tax=Methylophaga lonarensis TaxID=999151 RepID=UPI003D2687F0